jgi:hypothetical protein
MWEWEGAKHGRLIVLSSSLTLIGGGEELERIENK